MIVELTIDLDMNPVVLEALSTEEICDVCLHFNDRILTYFKDILFNNLIRERNLLYKCHTTIQWYFGMLRRLIISTKEDKSLSQIIIHNVTGINIENSACDLKTRTNRILVTLDSDLGTTSLMGIDPNIAVQILDFINGVCTRCLQARLKSPREIKLVQLCIEKVKYLSNHLRLVTNSLLFVNEKSYIHRLKVKVETLKLISDNQDGH